MKKYILAALLFAGTLSGASFKRNQAFDAHEHVIHKLKGTFFGTEWEPGLTYYYDELNDIATTVLRSDEGTQISIGWVGLKSSLCKTTKEYLDLLVSQQENFKQTIPEGTTLSTQLETLQETPNGVIALLTLGIEEEGSTLARILILGRFEVDKSKVTDVIVCKPFLSEIDYLSFIENDLPMLENALKL